MALPVNIQDLLRKQKIESNRIEFKKGWNPDKIYRTICAFANDLDNIGGGYILVGVEEERGRAKRPVLGIPEDAVDKIQKDMVGFNNKISPYYLPRVSVEEVDERQILAIWVPAGVNRPYEVRENVTARQSPNKHYIRSGSSTIEARNDVLDELRNMANRIPFDDRGNPNVSENDLSPLLVHDYLRRVNSKLVSVFRSMDFEEILEQMDLYVGPRESRMLKNVAAMMFCEDPSRFFPTTQVDIVVFPEGLEANPNNMIEVPRIIGPVPYMIRATLDYLRTNVVKERILKPKEQAESIRYFNYPYQALEEAVVNALYHRNYQEREPVEIRIEPDNITILSYSGPDRSISMEDIQLARKLLSRHYRNRRLGDFLKELNLSEGRATGIPTIQDELRKNGSRPARIRTDEDRTYFLMEIPCHEEFISALKVEDFQATVKHEDGTNEPETGENEPKTGGNEPKTGGNEPKEGTNEPKQEAIRKRRKEIQLLLMNDPKMTVTALSQILNVSQATAKRDLSLLSKEGRIRHFGSARNGYWQVVKN